MGFEQRQARRRTKAATGRAQAQARSTGSSASQWWLTPVRHTTACAVCGAVLRPAAHMIYRPQPQEARCQRCADHDPNVTYRPSLAWEKHAAQARQTRLEDRP